MSLDDTIDDDDLLIVAVDADDAAAAMIWSINNIWFIFLFYFLFYLKYKSEKIKYHLVILSKKNS